MKQGNPEISTSYLTPDWPGGDAAIPGNVRAYTTLISGGYSTGNYSHFNLATHVGDDIQAVMANREKLVTDLILPSVPAWLDQVHSNHVVVIEEKPGHSRTSTVGSIKADASLSRTKGHVCAVLTADCLPVFFCNRSGTEVAVAHAGWRGLHAGILGNTVRAMKSPVKDILVSYGPAIGRKAFEVGEEVLHAFVDKNSMNRSAFSHTANHHYLCDIYQLATIELQSIGVAEIAGGDYCTYSESHRFYSYRRQQNTGRMASIIWLT